MDRFDELVSEYLDGTLGPEGKAELGALLDADPARRSEFVDLVRESRILSVELGKDPSPEFTQRVLSELDKGKSGFVRAVMTDVRGGGSKTPPRPKRPLPPATPGWSMWFAVAAGVALVLGLLIFALGGDSEPPPRPRQAKQEKRKESPASEPKIEEPAPPPKPEPLPEPPKPPPPPRPQSVPAPEPAPVPSPAPKAEPPAPKPEPAPPKPEPRTTVVEVATLDHVEGDLVVSRGGQKKPVQSGDPVLAGDVLESSGTAVVKYADGTRVELRTATVAGFPASDAGKRIAVEHGTVRAQVAKQPAGQPMVFQSPHGDATVLGTTLRLVVDADGKEGTRLEVEEGKVRLLRKLDGKTVEVVTGHYAVVAPGTPFTSRLVRVTTGLQALYTFKEGKGGVVHDTAHVGSAIDLKIENEQAVRWTSKGLALVAPTQAASPAPATRLSQACKASNELAVEVWFRPATVTPPAKDGRIVVFSADFKNQNFLLGQDEFQGPVRSYFMRCRTTATDAVGKPDFAMPEGGATLRVTHLVYSRAASGAAAIYLDGVEAAKSTVAGNFSSWNDGYRIGLGNEFGGTDRAWLGEYHLVAIYGRALTPDDVKQNFKAGVE